MSKKFRPRVRLSIYAWHYKSGEREPGIAIVHAARNRVIAHMTPAEARAIADQLYDLTDQLDSPETTT